MKQFSVFCITVVTLLIILTGCAQIKRSPTEETRLKFKRPNFLFCVADDASYQHMGSTEWIRTPGFDRVASEGILFTHAYTPNAKCAPSRSCILTGRNSWQLEAAANHNAYFPGKFKTYPEVLAEAGYFTGYTGKGWAPGDPGTINGRPRELLGPCFGQQQLQPPTTGISPNDYAANFADFLAARPKDKPFCFWYGGWEPHRKYEYGSGIKKGGKDPSTIDRVFNFWPDNETVRTDLLDYAYEIEYFDKQLQKMLKMLEEWGELDNTVVIVTADNGMPFPRIKGQAYEYSNHLPLAIMWKGGLKKPGRVVNDIVNFIDFAPTFLELAHVKQADSGMKSIEGHSLTDILYSQKRGQVNPDRDHVLIGKERHDVGRPHDWGYPIRGIVKGGFLYVKNYKIDRWPAGDPVTGYLNCDGSPTKTVCLESRTDSDTEKYWQWSFGKRVSEELYQISTDPDCMNNLASDPEFQTIKNKLQEQMVKELKEQGDPRMFGNGSVFDEYPYAQPLYRNYYEKYMNGERIEANWVNPSDYAAEPIQEP